MKKMMIWALLAAPGIDAAELTYSQKIVALTILGESRGEGKRGMYDTAALIKQRMLNRKLSCTGVCVESAIVRRKKIHQFSCWNNRTVKQNSVWLKSTSAPYAIFLAKHLCNGGDLNRSAIAYADHYCTLNSYPSWIKGKTPVYKHGNHKYFRLKK